ncbi:hypothetical protein ABIE69_002990 [Rhodobacteraceae bacterium MBR-64]|jgi:hypothetical protein
MTYSGLEDFLRNGRAVLARGPVALIFADDGVEVDSTLRHCLRIGFRATVFFAPDRITTPPALADQVRRVNYDTQQDNALMHAVNRIIPAAPGVWFYYGYNAEYLFYPFCETRTIGECLTFHAEERRDAMLSYVVDLYADNLDRHPNAVSLIDACLDKSGYYALARRDAEGDAKERQLDFFGGLRWRFEEHIPANRRKIDRIALFRAKPGLSLREDFTFDDEEYNSYASPWHNNITSAICSFRTAKALRTNPGSKFDIHTFNWHNSEPFGWHSQQLMDLGLMEPGQWF